MDSMVYLHNVGDRESAKPKRPSQSGVNFETFLFLGMAKVRSHNVCT